VAIVAGLFSGEGSWKWFPAFYLDFPFSILLFPLLKVAPPFLVFAVLGTGWWYGISLVVGLLVRKIGVLFR